MTRTRIDVSVWDVPVAAVLLTRLPLPKIPDNAFERQARSVWAFPLVGLALGLVAAVVFWLAVAIGLPNAAGAGLAIVVLMVLSGGMHEDGLADTADGLWGGHDTARRLEIMKDSRIGAYGVQALIMVTGLRWVALTAAGPLALIVAATVSRAAMVPIMANLPYARPDGLARHVGQPPQSAALVAIGIAAIAALICAALPGIWACMVAAIIVWLISRVAMQRIAGQTGDILGACQQLAEVAVLLILAI